MSIFPVWAGSFALIVLCATYWHWRVYSLYKLLGEVGRKFTYTGVCLSVPIFVARWTARRADVQRYTIASTAYASCWGEPTNAPRNERCRHSGAIGVFAFVWDLVQRGA